MMWARDVMVSLASSSTVTPNFWVDPKAGIPYPVAVQTPPSQIGDLADLRNTVVGGPGAGGVTPTPARQCPRISGAMLRKA